MRRIIAVAGALALSAAFLPAATQAAVPENQYQVLSARNAYAAFFMTDGCYETQVWVSSTDAKFGGRPGPVNKQGLTSLSVVVYNTCLPWEGKHPPVVFSAFGQDFTALGTTPRITRAWVSTSYDAVNEVTGEPIALSFGMAWERTGALSHDPSHIHVPPSDQGVANAHENDFRGNAVAWGWVTIDGQTLELQPSTDAGLEIIKGGCQVIVRPGQPSDLACV